MSCLARSFEEVVAERGKGVAFRGRAKCIDDMGVDLDRGEGATGGNMREAHEGVHDGQLSCRLRMTMMIASADVAQTLRARRTSIEIEVSLRRQRTLHTYLRLA
jgi:hypothetical protein